MDLINSSQQDSTFSQSKGENGKSPSNKSPSPLKIVVKQGRHLMTSFSKHVHLPDKDKTNSGIKKIKKVISKSISHASSKKTNSTPCSFIEVSPSFQTEEATSSYSYDYDEVEDRFHDKTSNAERLACDLSGRFNDNVTREDSKVEFSTDDSCEKAEDDNIVNKTKLDSDTSSTIVRMQRISIIGIILMASSWFISGFLPKKKQPCATPTFFGSMYK